MEVSQARVAEQRLGSQFRGLRLGSSVLNRLLCHARFRRVVQILQERLQRPCQIRRLAAPGLFKLGDADHQFGGKAAPERRLIQL